jgi:sigma54-dependent transcription regulator
VLDRAQWKLAQTNLAFDYELVRGKNNSVEEIRFRFTPVTSKVLLPSLPATTDWQKALLEVGVSVSSMAAIGELIERGEIESSYVQYVVQQQRAKSKQEKIRIWPGQYS